jgi:topoisomerase-4 subunit A
MGEIEEASNQPIEQIDKNEEIESNDLQKILHIKSMFEDWFLDYASYVNLDRAVPDVNDGLKPVQRRILHSMWELEDGRYNKVANIVGNTMK